jgi:hypothetical protein
MAAETLRWLHLTDLHLGQSDDRLSWPVIQELFLEDLEHVVRRCGGPIDLVFFTGDLTFSGSQFAEVTDFLRDVWGAVSPKPALVCVPGNHDVAWPSEKNHTLLGFDAWTTDVSQFFWESRDNEYRKLVDAALSAYTDWNATHPFDRVSTPVVPGELPGDFSFSVIKGSYEIGVVGLNSTFRQLRRGYYKERLILDPRQLVGVCGPSYPRWIKGKSLCLLLTHHPPSWLSAEASQQFHTRIATQDYFALHLCGHSHKEESTWLRQGKHERRLSLGRSLCGRWEYTEYDKDSKHVVLRPRLYGYTVGQLAFAGEQATYREWPRELKQTQGSNWEFVPNLEVEGKLQGDEGTAAKVIPIRAVKKTKPSMPSDDAMRATHQRLSAVFHGTLNAANQIAESLHPRAAAPRHSFERVRFAYRITAAGDQEGEVLYVVRRPAVNPAGDGRVSLFRHWVVVEPDAPAVSFLDEIAFRIDEYQPGADARPATYLQTRNEPREKECAIFLLPEYDLQEGRKVVVSWRWKEGFARLLKAREEEVVIELRSADPISEIELSFEVDPQLGEIACTPVEVTADLDRGLVPGAAVHRTDPVRDEVAGWPRWSYRLQGASSGLYAVRLRRG